MNIGSITVIVAMRYLCPLLLLLLGTAPAFSQPLPEFIPYTDGMLWGYADTNGHVIIVPQWPGVELFQGNTAVVLSGDSTPDPGSNTYALINKKGEYIIPPSRRWRGTYTGWRGALNARDEQGHWGMIDTLNQIVIPFTWQATAITVTPDSLYKAVAKDGLIGIINRNNELIIPFRYSAANSIGPVNGVEAFMVTDTFTILKPNRYGVIDALGRILVPVGYNDIQYGAWAEGDGFHTRKVTDNKDPNQPVYQEGFIGAEGGEEVKRKNTGNVNYREQYIRQGNYYLYRNNTPGYALLDTNKKIVIPCCKVMKANADTVFLYEATNRDQTETVTLTYLDAATLKPLATPKVVRYYEEEIQWGPPKDACGNGVRSWYAARNRENALPEVNYEGRYTRNFFRDSLFFTVQGFAGNGPFPEVTGYRRGGGYTADMTTPRFGHRYFAPLARQGAFISVYSSVFKDSIGYFHTPKSHAAIVDQDAGYVVPPLPDGYYIEGFNPYDGLVTTRTRGASGALFSTRGILLAEMSGKEPRGAYRWKEKIYTYVVTATTAHGSASAWDDYYITEKIKLADDKGILVPALSAYHVAGAIIREGKTEVLALTDSSGMMGLFSPGGDNLYPEVNFKYRYLNVSPEGLLLVKDSLNRSGKLVDTHNRDLLNGIQPERILEATDRPPIPSFRQQPPYRENTIAGLYIATIRSSRNPQHTESFYIDRHGRIYKAGMMTTVEKTGTDRKRKQHQ